MKWSTSSQSEHYGNNIGKSISQFAKSQVFQMFPDLFHELENEKKEVAG